MVVLKEETDQRLQIALKSIITSHYASSTPELEEFQLAIRDKDVKDALSDFRHLVSLTNYEAYRPWLAKFLERLCQPSKIENLFALGLSSFLGTSSSTSGGKPKHFAWYLDSKDFARPVQGLEDSNDVKRNGGISLHIVLQRWHRHHRK